ncbi:Lactose permease [Diaporthe amygdali]|uniref:Lactose permease n=1 Tax=Phomopsis amygdali TaxID=1214568 RepID=UPI0022FF137E|nr:Lactose permease [Diaporthe amygdali]KAJ0106977.1 Lactose permease [Diaporthe amygdali]
MYGRTNVHSEYDENDDKKRQHLGCVHGRQPGQQTEEESAWAQTENREHAPPELIGQGGSGHGHHKLSGAEDDVHLEMCCGGARVTLLELEGFKVLEVLFLHSAALRKPMLSGDDVAVILKFALEYVSAILCDCTIQSDRSTWMMQSESIQM